MKGTRKTSLSFVVLLTTVLVGSSGLALVDHPAHAQSLAESGLPISEQTLENRARSLSASRTSDPFAEKSGSAYTQSGAGSNLTDQYLYEIPGLDGTAIQASLPKVGPQYLQSSSTPGWYSSSVMVAQIGVPLPPIG